MWAPAGMDCSDMGAVLLILADGGDVQRQLDAVADGEAAGLQRRIPLDAEVEAVNRRSGGEAGALLAVGVLALALELDVEDNFLGDVADGQVAVDLGILVIDQFDARRAEGRG